MIRQGLSAIVFAALCLSLAGCEIFMPERSLGEQVWRENCAECHGLDGAGKIPKYRRYETANLLDNYWENGGDDDSIESTIIDGIFPMMPEFPDLTAEERRAVIEYLRELRAGR